MTSLRARQRFGKYVIERRIAVGGFATVYQAMDTIEGIRVALKIPHSGFITEDTIESFKCEVQIAAKLEHPNILPIKHADFIGETFVVVTALGESSLDEVATFVQVAACDQRSNPDCHHDGDACAASE